MKNCVNGVRIIIERRWKRTGNYTIEITSMFRSKGKGRLYIYRAIEKLRFVSIVVTDHSIMSDRAFRIDIFQAK